MASGLPVGSAPERTGRLACVVILALTVGQLLVLTLVPDLAQAEGKAFGARLTAYPVLMLLVPTVWSVARRLRHGSHPLPWTGFSLLMAPFLVDVSGNTLDLYDSIGWWDDANHFTNWFLLCTGLGVLLLRQRAATGWALAATIAGAGAVLAILWEVAEWYSFIRHGTERDTAYEDTLGDEVLGLLGGTGGAVVVIWLSRRRPRPG